MVRTSSMRSFYPSSTVMATIPTHVIHVIYVVLAFRMPFKSKPQNKYFKTLSFYTQENVCVFLYFTHKSIMSTHASNGILQ